VIPLLRRHITSRTSVFPCGIAPTLQHPDTSNTITEASRHAGAARHSHGPESARSALDTTLFRLLHSRRQTIALTPLAGRVTGLTPNGEAHGINSTAPAFYGRYAALAPKTAGLPLLQGRLRANIRPCDVGARRTHSLRKQRNRVAKARVRAAAYSSHATYLNQFWRVVETFM
jgi:hypothetical protein